MSIAVGAVNYILSNAAGMVALVPAARIATGPIVLGTRLPAVGVLHISGDEFKTVSMTETRVFRWARIQVVAHAEDYAGKKAILAAARAALRAYRGTANGVAVDSILPDVEGPDLDEPGVPLYEQSQDFIVKWTE